MEASFGENGYGLWALEERSSGTFVGFTGLALQTFEAHFTPAVEVGRRLAAHAWGCGYATEAATACLDLSFGDLGLEEVVSMTATVNTRSIAVMERLGMTRDPADDFDHPRVPEGHLLRPHVLYRISAAQWAAPGRTAR
jgi:ribosomal-protein-alanine N-acetyltransferase